MVVKCTGSVRAVWYARLLFKKSVLSQKSGFCYRTLEVFATLLDSRQHPSLPWVLLTQLDLLQHVSSAAGRLPPILCPRRALLLYVPLETVSFTTTQVCSVLPPNFKAAHQALHCSVVGRCNLMTCPLP